ncbi:MAG: VCBS repeat-containing protein, partial [Planctomycetaceae bacterium]
MTEQTVKSLTESGCRLFALLALVLVSSKSECGEPVSQFADVYSAAGGAFRHESPLTEARHIHLTMGSGVACFDYDNDGWCDLFFGQGCAWTGKFRSTQKKQDALLRNKAGMLSDVTELAGLNNPWYAMGIACTDSDNDGFEDLYVSTFGQNLYFHNCGDGTFSPGVTLATAEDCYSASCTWTDANGDGNADIFVTRYVAVSEKDYPLCVDEPTKLGILCPPWRFKALSDVLLISEGDGTFTDRSLQAGLQSVDSLPGLAVATLDFDDDGDLDIYVANDSVPNHLWINDGHGQFTEDGILAGVALNGNGLRQAGM